MDYICFIVYAILAVIWIVLALRGTEKHKDMTDPLDSNKYMLKSLYGVGFEILNLIHYSYDMPMDRKRIKQAEIVYGERFAQYYYRVNVAEKVTYLSIAVVLSPLLCPLFGGAVYILFGLFGGGIAYYYADSKITDIISDRELSISSDFADMVSKMALLINAGMITREAWTEIAYNDEGVLYEEMRITVLDIQNGVSEIDAYIAFGNRCGIPYIRKFISMLVQNISKGNKELVDFLKAESVICWEEKKNLVKRQGEAAGNKLMLPLGLILVGIFIMILVPIISKMGI